METGTHPLRLLSDRDLERIWGLKVASVRKSRCTGTGALADLPYLKIGKNIRYRVQDVEDFLAKHRVTP